MVYSPLLVDHPRCSLGRFLQCCHILAIEVFGIDLFVLLLIGGNAVLQEYGTDGACRNARTAIDALVRFNVHLLVIVRGVNAVYGTYVYAAAILDSNTGGNNHVSHYWRASSNPICFTNPDGPKRAYCSTQTRQDKAKYRVIMAFLDVEPIMTLADGQADKGLCPSYARNGADNSFEKITKFFRCGKCHPAENIKGARGH